MRGAGKSSVGCEGDGEGSGELGHDEDESMRGVLDSCGSGPVG